MKVYVLSYEDREPSAVFDSWNAAAANVEVYCQENDEKYDPLDWRWYNPGFSSYANGLRFVQEFELYS